MEATAPELGPVRFWSMKSSSFSGSDSIVVEEAVITKTGGGAPVPPTIEFTGTSESQNDFGVVMPTLREIAYNCDTLRFLVGVVYS